MRFRPTATVVGFGLSIVRRLLATLGVDWPSSRKALLPISDLLA